MAEPLSQALTELHARVDQPCSNCGLRFGTCAHTREARPLLDLVDQLIGVIQRHHYVTGIGQHGHRCASCTESTGECQTKHEAVKVLSG